eukprot:CAMPEP_0119466848 /NCGR_PEP_ID=MMETSP1344-20130328/1311_1 /TAXON_ID=236787 /ORGANISM="Florenciella parvula, Strain CCMP2471" /LENGTH=82 /DNA_ID=CAMNT_0007499179 /DNA_START=206 /DNA_END=455 /DNA_ORIENTATION=-
MEQPAAAGVVERGEKQGEHCLPVRRIAVISPCLIRRKRFRFRVAAASARALAAARALLAAAAASDQRNCRGEEGVAVGEGKR